MAFDSKAVANHFLDLAESENEAISPMKIQKLVYIAHGWYLALTEKPLLDEYVQAWKYGPVIPTLFHEFKRFGREAITEPATDFDPRNNTFAKTIMSDDKYVKAILEKVYEVYGDFTAIQLSNLTHQPDTPWAETWAKSEGTRNVNIENELIKGHFQELAGMNAGN